MSTNGCVEETGDRYHSSLFAMKYRSLFNFFLRLSSQRGITGRYFSKIASWLHHATMISGTAMRHGGRDISDTVPFYVLCFLLLKSMWNLWYHLNMNMQSVPKIHPWRSRCLCSETRQVGDHIQLLFDGVILGRILHNLCSMFFNAFNACLINTIFYYNFCYRFSA